MLVLLVIDHADSTRVTFAPPAFSNRCVASTGLYTPDVVISPASIAITSSSPGSPGPTNASPTGHTARTAPATRSTAGRP